MKQYMMGLFLLLLTGCQQAIDHMMRDNIVEDRMKINRDSNVVPAVFMRHCMTCHLPADQQNDGMMLKGVVKRWPDEKSLRAFIRDSQHLIETGHRYANNLYNNWNHALMPVFPNLTEPEMDSLIIYLK